MDKALGLSYVGISLDGLRETHDRFRRQAGAFDAALKAVRLCRSIGLKVGLRFTIFKENAGDIPGIFAVRCRAAAGPTAPARGLFLHSVEYD